jgi:prephenate dehydrogenase
MAGDTGRLLVVGAGLIGTSVGLAARAAHYDVVLAEPDPARLGVAVELGAGQQWDGGSQVDLAVVAVPPSGIAAASADLIRSGIAPTVTHVGSVQHRSQVEVEELVGLWSGFVGSHPIAGRERPGPHHATADLFRDRPWVVCPTPGSSPVAVEAVRSLAKACGAVVHEMPAADHDTLLARLSHAPQLVASALAAAVAGLSPDQVALAGAGLRDSSRLADSDPTMWAEIVEANPAAVAEALAAVTGPLVALEARLRGHDPSVSADVRDLLGRGRAGRERLAGKHGQAAVAWARVSVVVPDQPGALARLLTDAADAGVNVEDIRVDHSPGLPLGVVELDVSPGSSAPLATALAERGWNAAGSEPPPRS